MTSTENEVLDFIRKNDVKFIRLGFCDIFGTQKNISIMPEELESAFKNGISFDASAIEGFGDVTKSDLLLFPDPATITILPWRPGPGRVVRFYCDIKNPDKTDFTRDSRYILRQTLKRCEEMGYVCKIGAECEFYLFKTDENGEPTLNTLDNGGYFDMAPLDKGENIRREICLDLDEMGLKPETSHHEQGPGQNEIDFRFDDALSSADNLQTFKTVVKAIAQRNGLYASFMPKPILNQSGSGLHINISLSQNGFNIFQNKNEKHSKVSESFIAGILNKTPEITLFLNPTANSYERLGKNKAPKFVSWSHQNRSQLIRIPAAIGERVRMELRSPDPAINPYLAFALIIGAGLYGVENELALPAPVDADLFTADKNITQNLIRLPATLDEAIYLAENSEFVNNIIGNDVSAEFINTKKEEAAMFNKCENKESFYKEKYFKFI